MRRGREKKEDKKRRREETHNQNENAGGLMNELLICIEIARLLN